MKDLAMVGITKKPISSTCQGYCGGIQPTTVVFRYPLSEGQQTVSLCDGCAKEWWSKFKNTDCGQGLIIQPFRSIAGGSIRYVSVEEEMFLEQRKSAWERVMQLSALLSWKEFIWSRIYDNLLKSKGWQK